MALKSNGDSLVVTAVRLPVPGSNPTIFPQPAVDRESCDGLRGGRGELEQKSFWLTKNN
jgi:hypothetical protein